MLDFDDVRYKLEENDRYASFALLLKLTLKCIYEGVRVCSEYIAAILSLSQIQSSCSFEIYVNKI